MQIQKVNSSQNFEGGLVRLKPTHYIDVDAIQELHALNDQQIFLSIVGREEGICINFKNNAKQICEKAMQKLKEAKRILTGSTNETIILESTRTMPADSIERIFLSNDIFWVTSKENTSTYSINSPKSFKEFVEEIHRAKTKAGNIIDLFS